MNSMLKYSQKNGAHDLHLTRLNLARKAITMLYEKLQDNDVFSLVIFHTQALTIIKSTFKKNLSPETFQSTINKQFESGGTTIK